MNTQCIMVCSGKGGTGKSTVSVLLGACLARLGRKVLLIELDSGLRSVDIIAGVYGRTVYDIEDVLCGRCEGAKAVVPSPLYPGLSVISAPYEGGAVDAAPLGRLLVAMRPYFDFVILDTAAGMGAPFTAAAAVAEMVELDYVNDDRYAETRAHGLLMARKSRRAAAQNLRQKGLNSQQIEQALETVYALDENGESPELEAAAALVASRYRKKLADGRRDLVVAALQRRGFAYAVIKEAIRRTEEEL